MRPLLLSGFGTSLRVNDRTLEVDYRSEGRKESYRPQQLPFGSVVEDFVRHRDRKYTFNAEGRAVRRHVLARRRSLVGLGKEANRVDAGRVLGQVEVGGRAKRYVNPDPFNGSAAEVARRLGVSRRTVFNRRAKVQKARRSTRST